MDEPGFRDLVCVAYDRGHNPAGVARQLHAITTSGDRTKAAAPARLPALVVHGTADPLVRPGRRARHRESHPRTPGCADRRHGPRPPGPAARASSSTRSTRYARGPPANRHGRTAGFTELVAGPGEGRVFEQTHFPGIADAGADGRVRLDAIARWLQDVAYADLLDVGANDEGAWIVRKARMRVERFPRFGEAVTIRTFCSGLGRFSAERRTSVTGASAAVEAVATWVWIDAETGRPRRFPQRFLGEYEASAAGRDASVRLRHPDPPDDCERRAWRFRATDEDVAGHVNNSHYWAPLEEELASGAPEPFDAEIEYREPMLPGDAVVLRAPGGLWIAPGDREAGGPVSVSIQIAD